jgi:hypothetical protein
MIIAAFACLVSASAGACLGFLAGTLCSAAKRADEIEACRWSAELERAAIRAHFPSIMDDEI